MSTQLATFYVADYLYGVDVAHVQEVLKSQARTRVPLAPARIEGLINLRGDVVTAIDLRKRLNLPERPADQEPMVVVIRLGNESVSLLVDVIGDVIDVDPAAFEPPPDTLDGPARELILGAYKLERQLLLALDVEKAVSG